MSANVISENPFAQVDQESNRFVLIKSIIDTRTDGTQTLQQDVFVITNSGTKIRINTTKGWDSTSNGRMAVPYGTNLNISRIRIQYKLQSMQLRIEFWRSQNFHGGLNTC